MCESKCESAPTIVRYWQQETLQDQLVIFKSSLYNPRGNIFSEQTTFTPGQAGRKTLYSSKTERRSPSVEALKIMGGLEEEESKRVKSNISKAWLQGPHSLSRQSCRFELPMDMLVLEQLSPLQYVSQFCRVNSRRKTLFRHYFVKNDRDRDGVINKRELQSALRDLYAQSINTAQVDAILELLDVEKSMHAFDLDVFTAVAAFSERYLYYCSSLAVQNQTERRMVLEEIDFCALRWKLEGCKIDDKLTNVLAVL